MKASAIILTATVCVASVTASASEQGGELYAIDCGASVPTLVRAATEADAVEKWARRTADTACVERASRWPEAGEHAPTIGLAVEHDGIIAAADGADATAHDFHALTVIDARRA